MSRICYISKKRPMKGNRRSHAMNATKRRFLPNLQFHRFWIKNKNRYVRLRISTKGMRILDKKEKLDF
ncbi:50S ribosomal protein L28 [Candidatus Westeberhardia cardiocondylae]|uniref:Large ribosomal subunit protein bL28 n=1 Tax=Candidatus Westeberhardia cardiocondylae TaxID=1594731 RepID=A0A0H5BWM5_9ENTR|nr:50S ribosomal protein L28 [Candidatus Westeberhardia cardiocondylae]CEN32009.1 50S ribosomal protein L28 [Candidatus Westeberhardia cardiocondylae]